MNAPVALDSPALALRLPAELAVVLPAFNEVRNVPLLVAALEAALPDVAWEAVFVDDNSPDGTAEEVRRIAREDPRVRIVHRYGRPRSVVRLHRGRDGDVRTLHRGDGCRHAA